MTPADHNADRSIVGPFLVLLVGLAFSGLMLFQLIGHLRFVFAGVSAQATVTRKEQERDGRRITLQYSDKEEQEHGVELAPPDHLWNQLAEGDSLLIRYLPGNPPRARLEVEVHSAWPWKLAWVVLGLGITVFGVLLTWGRRPRRPGRWRSSPDRPW